ncbi:hypothetical protein B0H13DRAFT_2058852 [Mycena leptocephala]|nr:hypothetical protein B0H13DRAFT_2058852 [Mycena leptocephala]
MPSSDGAREPSQAATSLKRPPPSPLASERTKVTRVRTADSLCQRSLPTSGAQENDGFTVELNTRNPAHTRLTLTGDKPSLNDWESFVIDHQRDRLYSYGGVAPYDKSYTPTSDFHCLDLRTMEWKNISPSLRFRKDATESVFKELPALNEPASALMLIDSGTFMFLFGGYDPRSKSVTADLIAINLDLLLWCRSEDDCPGISTYSIAVYNSQVESTWAVSDRPLPSALPPLGYSIRAIPVNEGAEILLTRGYVEHSEPFSLSPDTIILFDTENHNFTTASKTMGNFPSGIRWHLLGSIVAAGPSPENYPSSVVLVAWVPHTFAEDVLVPEIWQYFLAPLPRIRCLNLRETFLNHDLHSFIAVGNRMLLLGSKEGHDSQDEAHVKLPEWDFTIEVSSKYLVGQ